MCASIAPSLYTHCLQALPLLIIWLPPLAQQDGLTLAPCAGHLSERLANAGVKGRHLTLKIKRKKAGAPEPYKFMVWH